MSTTVPYESNMLIFYDAFTKMVVVTFREKVGFLGPFVDKSTAYEAAEDFCRKRGWKG
jgi:hypothetical protein